MFSSAKKPAAQQSPAPIASLRIQTSLAGLVLPVVMGQNRVPVNIFWANDFVATAHTSASAGGGGSGGKGVGGGGSAATETTTYTYSAAMLLGLCEGPITGLAHVYQGKSVTTAAALGLALFLGSRPQTPFGYLTTNHPGQDLAYPGFAFAAGSAWDLGSSASLPNTSMEVQTAWSIGGGILDIDPKDAVTQILTNPYWGACFPAGLLDSLTPYSNYCVASGLVLSPILDEQRAASSWLEDLAKITNSQFVFSAGLLSLVPLGDVAVTANGRTYTPSLAPQYDLTDLDFLPRQGEDPVTLERSDPADADNCITLEVVDRAASYAATPVEAKAQAEIELYGLKAAGSIKAHAITSPAVGRQVVQLMLQRSIGVRNKYRFRLGWRYCRLEPIKDCVTLTDAGLGLAHQLVRILSKTEQQGGDGGLDFLVEEIPTGVASAAVYGSAGTAGLLTNLNITPGAANAPVVFDAPLDLTDSGGAEVWLAISGASANWGGADVWISSDGTTYKKVARVSGGARMGVLTTGLVVGTDPDAVHTVGVDVSQSYGATLAGGTLADADALHTLAYIGPRNGPGELVAFQNAALTSAGHYTLSYLRRGAYLTGIGAHLAGDYFARLDQAVAKIPYSADQIGKTISVKLVSFNGYGNALEDIASVAVYTYTLAGPPKLPIVTHFAAQQTAGAVALKWDPIASPAVKGFDIRLGPLGTRSFGAMQEISQAARGTEMTSVAVPPGSWSFAIEARDRAEQLSGLPAFADLVVTNAANILVAAADICANPALATLTNFVPHWTGVLVPKSQDLASAGGATPAGWACFDQFVPNPFATCTAELTTPLDGLVDGNVRLYAPVAAQLGPGAAGAPSARLQMDYRTAAGAFLGYQPWTVGNVMARYGKALLTLDTTSGVAFVSQFVPTMDVATQVDSGTATTTLTGVAITYAKAFRSPPNLQITPIGGTATGASGTAATAAGATLHAWLGSVELAGQVLHWTAEGP